MKVWRALVMVVVVHVNTHTEKPAYLAHWYDCNLNSLLPEQARRLRSQGPTSIPGGQSPPGGTRWSKIRPVIPANGVEFLVQAHCLEIGDVLQRCKDLPP